MKKWLFPISVILLVAAGCLPAPTPPSPANQLPTAYIDSISPTKVPPGETVVFKGYGTDPDGEVVAYQWRSNVNGEISTSATFETSSLSQGAHTIHFKVQDNRGDWSEEVYYNIVVLPSGVALPVVDLFEASPPNVAEGEFSTLSWSVSDASAVKIDPGIGDVALSGNREVSPAKTTVYTLTATNETGTITATSEISVVAGIAHTLELFSIAAEDGHVKKTGEVGPEPNVGDTASGCSMQAFLSFDISMIPAEATIKSASLDLTTADIFGYPFSKLGLLRIYNHQYATLDRHDFIIGAQLGAIYSTSMPPANPFSSTLLNSAIQSQVDAGKTRFQVRLQFERYSFNDRIADYLALGEAEPRLVIKYEN